ITIVSSAAVQSADVDILINGIIRSTGAGDINITIPLPAGIAEDSATGSIVMGPDARVVSNDGNIRLTGYGDQIITGVEATNGDVSIISENGDILDGGDNRLDIIGIDLRMVVQGGIGTLGTGTADPLDIDVVTIAAQAGDGGISIREQDDLIIGTVGQVPGRQIQDFDNKIVVQDDALLAGLKTGGLGSIVVQTVQGSLTVDRAVSADGSGNILLVAPGTGSDVYLNAYVRSESGNISVLAAGSVYQAATVDEGGTVTLTSEMVSAADADNLPEELTYILDTAPSHGTIYLDGAALSQGDGFTQADLDGYLVTYTHDGSETDSDSFDFTVYDFETGSIGATFHIAVDPVNDPPVNHMPDAPLVTNEGIDLEIPNIIVSDADAGQLTVLVLVSITQPVSMAILHVTEGLGTTVTGNDSDQIAIEGTLDAINAALATLVYQLAAADANFTDVLRIRTYDNGKTGMGGLQTDTDTVSIKVNDIPVVSTNVALAVIEGDTAVIDESGLEVTDDDNIALDLSYVLISIPVNGVLQLSGDELMIGSIFTQDDINNNRIAYTHDGSETISDSFDFAVTDGAGEAVSGSFEIGVTLQNEPPIHTVPDGRYETNEGVELGLTGINVTDPDVGEHPVTITLTITRSGKAAISGVYGQCIFIIHGCVSGRMIHQRYKNCIHIPDKPFDDNDF
ncbi:cadherin-like domain-containing protein, partial [Thermodesulfobacteriota bacterium]